MKQKHEARNMYQFHNWINKLFSEENKVLEHCWKLERWQGPPHINKVKQYEIVLSFKVRLLVYSVVRRKRVCLFSLFRQEQIIQLITIFFSQNYRAHKF